MDSYRGISLFTHFNKVNEILLWGRISEWWVKERRISTYRALIKRGSLVSTQFPRYKSQYCTPGEARQSFVTSTLINALIQRKSCIHKNFCVLCCFEFEDNTNKQSMTIPRYRGIIALYSNPGTPTHSVSLLQEPILYAWRSAPKFSWISLTYLRRTTLWMEGLFFQLHEMGVRGKLLKVNV